MMHPERIGHKDAAGCVAECSGLMGTCCVRHHIQLPISAAMMNQVCCRTVQMLADGVYKKVEGFDEHVSDLHTSFDAVKAAYDAANEAAIAAGRDGQSPCLVSSKTAPTLDQYGCYKVTTTPCGYDPQIDTDQV